MRSLDRLSGFEVAVLQALLSGTPGGAAIRATTLNYSKSMASSTTERIRFRYGANSTYALFLILRERGFITPDMRVIAEPEMKTAPAEDHRSHSVATVNGVKAQV